MAPLSLQLPVLRLTPWLPLIGRQLVVGGSWPADDLKNCRQAGRTAWTSTPAAEGCRHSGGCCLRRWKPANRPEQLVPFNWSDQAAGWLQIIVAHGARANGHGQQPWWSGQTPGPPMGRSACGSSSAGRLNGLASRSAAGNGTCRRQCNDSLDMAGALGALIGDLPFYVAHDKCRCLWANRQLFSLRSDGSLFSKAVFHADYFSEQRPALGHAVPCIAGWRQTLGGFSLVEKGPGAPTPLFYLLRPRPFSAPLRLLGRARDATTAQAGRWKTFSWHALFGQPAGAWRWTLADRRRPGA